MYTPTPGSTAGVASVWPMPRMKTCAAELLPVSVPYEWNWMLGATLSRSVVLMICCLSSASALSAVTATGVSCRLSARRRAVTTMASRASLSSASGSACFVSGGACATALPPWMSRQENTSMSQPADERRVSIVAVLSVKHFHEPPPVSEYLYVTHTICIASDLASGVDSRQFSFARGTRCRVTPI